MKRMKWFWSQTRQPFGPAWTASRARRRGRWIIGLTLLSYVVLWSAGLGHVPSERAVRTALHQGMTLSEVEAALKVRPGSLRLNWRDWRTDGMRADETSSRCVATTVTGYVGMLDLPWEWWFYFDRDGHLTRVTKCRTDTHPPREEPLPELPRAAPWEPMPTQLLPLSRQDAGRG